MKSFFLGSVNNFLPPSTACLCTESQGKRVPLRDPRFLQDRALDSHKEKNLIQDKAVTKVAPRAHVNAAEFLKGI